MSFETNTKNNASVEHINCLMKLLNRQNAFIGWLTFAVYPFNFLHISQYQLINSQWQSCHHLCPIEVLACKTNFAILSYARNDRYPLLLNKSFSCIV